MNFIKRAFWSVKARKGKSLLLLVVLSVISVFVLSGLTIETAAEKSSELARQKLGGDVTLTVDREKLIQDQSGTEGQTEGRQARFQSVPIPEESAQSLIDSEYLLGYNFYSSTTALASGFTAIGSTTEETAEEESGNGGFGGGGFGGNAADVSVQGIVYSDAVDLFMDGEAELTEGRHITEEDAAANVVMIEQNLADENDLSVGDSLTVVSSETEEDVSLEIVGIYSTTAEVDQQAQNFSFLNPYNMIYIPYETANMIKGEEGTLDSAIYYIDDPVNIESFIADAQNSSEIDFETFKLDADDSLYQQMMGPINNVSSFSNKVVILVAIAGAVILGLIVMMSIRERKYEMGVLLAIGEKRSKLIGQFLAEILLIAVFALGLSVVSGNFVADTVGNQLLQQELVQSEENTRTPNSFAGRGGDGFPGGGFQGGGQFGGELSAAEEAEMIDDLSIAVTAADLTQLLWIGLLVIVISTVLPALSVLRLNPKMILTTQD